MHGYMLREKFKTEKEFSETNFETLGACVTLVVRRAQDRPGDPHEWTILKRHRDSGSYVWEWLPIASSDALAKIHKTKIVE